jgi:hypothetical protein
MTSEGKLKIWGRVIVAVLVFGGAAWFVCSKQEVKNPEMTRYAQARVPDENANVTRANAAAIAAKESESDHKVVDRLNITFRAVGLNRVSPGADQELAFNVLNEMQSSAFFEASKTRAVGEISPEAPLSEPPVKSEQGDPPGTFTFKIEAKLKRPLTL